MQFKLDGNEVVKFFKDKDASAPAAIPAVSVTYANAEPFTSA